MRALAAILLLTPTLALADDVLCLQSPGTNKPIQLQMTLFTSAQGGWRGAGQVQYRGQPDSLPIVFKDSELMTENEGRLSEFRVTWLEVLPTEEKLGGRYQFHYQGAVIFSFTYTSSTGKVFAFEMKHVGVDSNNNCIW